MTRRLLALLIAAACVVAGGGVAAWLALRPTSTTSGGGGATTARLPGKKGIDALQQLAQPIAIGPLAGSVPAPGIGGGYIVGKSCADVRAAYHAAGAPLPAGAKLSDDPSGALVVTDVYGDHEGIVFEDRENGACGYTLASSPTLSVTGAGPVPEGDYWATVGCADLYHDLSKGETVAVFTAAGLPYVFVIGTQNPGATPPPPTAYFGLLVQGTPQSLSGSDTAGGQQFSVTVTVTIDGRITAKLGGASTQTVTVACTTQFGRAAAA